MIMTKLFFNILLFLVFLLPAVLFSQDSVRFNNSFGKSESFFDSFEEFNFVTASEIILKDTVYSDIKVFKNKSTSFKKDRNFLIIGLTGGAALLGTYATYRFKEISNEAYDNFKTTGEQSRYDKSREYDVYFYISLALTQIAFSALMYFLFFD